MSSVFLNSPSTRMTSPFSSTSVHRNRGSRDAFAVMALLLLNIDEPCSNSSWRKSSGFKGPAAFFEPNPHSLSCHVGGGSGCSSERCHFCKPVVVLKNCFGAVRAVRPVGRSRRSRSSIGKADASRAIWLVCCCCVLALTLWQRVMRSFWSRHGVKKASSFCDRKNRRRFREGAGVRSADGIAIRDEQLHYQVQLQAWMWLSRMRLKSKNAKPNRERRENNVVQLRVGPKRVAAQTRTERCSTFFLASNFRRTCQLDSPTLVKGMNQID